MQRDWMKKAREQANLTQRELRNLLEKECGYKASLTTISYWESGRTTPPVAACAFMCKILGVDMTSVVDEEVGRKGAPA